LVAQAFGDDHRGAEKVLILSKWLSGMNPDAHFKGPLGVGSIVLGKCTLHRYSTLGPTNRAVEGRHDAVSEVLDLPTPEIGQDAPQNFEVCAPQFLRCFVAQLVQHLGRADEVGEEQSDDTSAACQCEGSAAWVTDLCSDRVLNWVVPTVMSGSLTHAMLSVTRLQRPGTGGLQGVPTEYDGKRQWTLTGSKRRSLGR
jgi:hypothetical protein